MFLYKLFLRNRLQFVLYKTNKNHLITEMYTKSEFKQAVIKCIWCNYARIISTIPVLNKFICLFCEFTTHTHKIQRVIL